MKDWLLATAARVFIDGRIQRYGNMTAFHIDTERKSVAITLDLKGESSPIEIQVEYHRGDHEGEMVIEVANVRASREWITELAAAYLTQSPIKFPVTHPLIARIIRILNI